MYRIIVIFMWLSISLIAMEVHMVDGITHIGSSIIVKDGIVHLDNVQLNLADIVSCSWANPRQKNIQKEKISRLFFLADGSIIRGVILQSVQDVLTVESLSLGRVRFNITQLISISTSGRVPITKDGDTDKDYIVFPNGDILTGIIKQVSVDGFAFESMIGLKHYSFDDVYEVHLQTLPIHNYVSDKPYPVLEFFSGERVLLRSFSQNEKDVFGDSLVLGKIQINREFLQIMKIKNGRLEYLSDHTPVSIQERPYWKDGFVWHYRRDMSIDNNPITLNSIVYEKGIGAHSYSRLTYSLNQKYMFFSAIIGIDDEVDSYGSVDIRVYGDDAVLVEYKDIAAKNKPKNIHIDISHINTLILEVDFGKNLDTGDHLDWADARLIRKKEIQ